MVDIRSSFFATADKLRRLARQAERNNAFDLPALSQPPQWVTGVTYTSGDVVQNAGSMFVAASTGVAGATPPTIITNGTANTDGTVLWTYVGSVEPTSYAPSFSAWAATTAYVIGDIRTNGGRTYACIVAGTSAGSGGPVSKNLGIPEVDNTATWVLFPTPVDPSAPMVSILTVAPSATLPNVYNPDTFPNLFGLDGCYRAASSPTGYIRCRTLDQIGGTELGGMSTVTLITDAPVFAFTIGSNDASVRILVDGRLWNPSGFNVGSGNHYIVMDFRNYGGRKRRTIKVLGNKGGDRNIGSVYMTALDQLMPRDTAEQATCVAISDSLWAGSSYGPFLSGASVPKRIGAALGWSNVWDMALGGTGYIATNTGASYTYGQRIAQGLTRNPDIWLLFGSTNDIGQTAATITAAALAALQAIRAGGSTAPIVVFGTWPLDDSASVLTSKIAYVENAVKAAVTAFADPLSRTFFIPIRQDPEGPWVTGTWNNVTAWIASTSYALKVTRSNGGNDYVCTTAGTSSASGGPAGTGTGIADGTAVWDYIGPASGWAGNSQSTNKTMMIGGDNTHPADIASEYMARRMTSAIKKSVLPFL